MIEAFYLGLYLLILSPLLIYLGVDSPGEIAFGLFILSIPGVYALVTGAPFLPTQRKIVKDMIRIADLKKGDKVYDLGCGDGRILVAAARAGAIATGYELSIPLYVWAKVRSFFNRNVKVYYRNLWKESYKDADVIFCFLMTQAMERLEKEIWPQLKSGTKVVSNTFKLPNLEPVSNTDGAKVYIKP